MKRLLKQKWLWELFKYGVVTAVGYVFLLGGTFVLKEWLGLNQSLAYFTALTLVYIGVYISYTKFVFKSKFSGGRAIKFIALIVFQWLFNNLFFNLMTIIFDINYLVAAILNIVIFGGARFVLQRTLVFKK